MSNGLTFISMPRRSGKTTVIKERLEAHIRQKENTIVVVRDKQYLKDWDPELLKRVYTPQEIRDKELAELQSNGHRPLRAMVDDVLWDYDAHTVASLFFDLGRFGASVESYSSIPNTSYDMRHIHSGIRKPDGRL